jgi:hypothetical protein
MTSYLRRFDSIALVALLLAGGPAAAEAPAKPKAQFKVPTHTSKTRIGKFEIKPLAPLRTPVKKVTLPPRDPKSKIGAPCKHTDTARKLTKTGVVQRDACGRLYCAAKAGTDIFQLHPNIHRLRHCTWQVDARKLCVCKGGNAPRKS